ncbi:MAG: hypothetical protein ACI9ZD_001818, partial [Paracoccaceae bacterium]
MSASCQSYQAFHGNFLGVSSRKKTVEKIQMPLSNLDDLPTYLMKWYGVTDLGFAPEKLSTANHRSSADVTGGH